MDIRDFYVGFQAQLGLKMKLMMMTMQKQLGAH